MKEIGFTVKKARRRYPVKILTDRDYADDPAFKKNQFYKKLFDVYSPVVDNL